MNYQDEKDFEKESQYELYPFDAGRCDCCKNEQFKNGNSICQIYNKHCSAIRGCNHFLRDYPVVGITLH